MAIDLKAAEGTALAAAFAWGQWRVDAAHGLTPQERALLDALDCLSKKIVETMSAQPEIAAEIDAALKLGA